jgi:hypothetical protein
MQGRHLSQLELPLNSAKLLELYLFSWCPFEEAAFEAQTEVGDVLHVGVQHAIFSIWFDGGSSDGAAIGVPEEA